MLERNHVGFCFLRHYGDSDELCAFVGLHFSSLTVMRRMENVGLD
jgi:hypothetical protein